jgi:predicted small lipoprotein YifL
MTRRAAAVLLLAVASLAGCGLKGPLYLPEKSKEVVVRPAPAEPTTTEPAPPASEPTAAPPTPPPGSGRG